MAKEPAATQDPEVAEAAAGPEMAGKPGETVIVRGPEDGRWRGGRQFGPVDVTIDLSTITMDDMHAIATDPYLSVRRS